MRMAASFESLQLLLCSALQEPREGVTIYLYISKWKFYRMSKDSLQYDRIALRIRVFRDDNAVVTFYQVDAPVDPPPAACGNETAESRMT